MFYKFDFRILIIHFLLKTHSDPDLFLMNTSHLYSNSNFYVIRMLKLMLE